MVWKGSIAFKDTPSDNKLWSHLAATLAYVRSSRASRQRAEHDRLVQAIVSMREEVKMSQRELARRLGWKQQSVIRLERGERSVELVEFIDICRILERDPNEVFALISSVRT